MRLNPSAKENNNPAPNQTEPIEALAVSETNKAAVKSNKLIIDFYPRVSLQFAHANFYLMAYR